MIGNRSGVSSSQIKITAGMRDSLDIIFSGILFGGMRKDHPEFQSKSMTVRVRLNRFSRAFKYNIFHDEYAIFYSIIESYRVKVFTESQLLEMLNNNSQTILESEIIDFSNLVVGLNKLDLSNDEVFDIFKQYIVKRFHEMSNKVVNEEEFESAIEVYRQSYYNLLFHDTVQKMALIMSDNGVLLKDLGKRSKRYQGPLDAQEFYMKKMQVLETLLNEDDSDDVLINGDWYSKQHREANSDAEEMVQTGIEELDETIGSLNRGYLYTILGPTKGGKTTLTAYLVSILLLNGYNVAVWAIEGSKHEWVHMITACFCFLLGDKLISRSVVRKRNFTSKEEENLVNSMELRLASDKRLGRLSFIGGTCYVEELRDKLSSHYKNTNPFDCIVIDQLIKILSKNNKPKVDRIGEGYTIVENFCKKECESKPLALLPSQLKPKAVEAMRKDPTIDIQDTDGAESSEVVRSIDLAIGLFSTDQEKDAGIMRVHCVAARHTAKFKPFRCACDLGSVAFWSDPSLSSGSFE